MSTFFTRTGKGTFLFNIYYILKYEYFPSQCTRMCPVVKKKSTGCRGLARGAWFLAREEPSAFARWLHVHMSSQQVQRSSPLFSSSLVVIRSFLWSKVKVFPSCPPSSLSFCIAWIGPSALSLSLSLRTTGLQHTELFFFFFYPPTPAQSNPTLYLRHAKLSPFSSARLLLQPPHEVHVLSESLLPPPHLLPLSLPPPPPTTTFPLSLLQFSHVQSYKPAGPWRRADDTAKRAQLVLRNCELDSYVQPHIYLSSVYLFIFYIFVKTLQLGWGGTRTARPDGPDLPSAQRTESSWYYAAGGFGRLLFVRPQTRRRLRLAKRRGNADKLIEGQLPGLRGSFDHCYTGTTKGFLNDVAICDTAGFLLHFFIYLFFPTEKQAIIWSGKVLEGGTLVKECPGRHRHQMNISPLLCLEII